MKPFFSSLIAVVVLLVLALWLFPNEDARPVSPPWQIEKTDNGNIRVMGITLGRTTLQQVVDLYGEPPELSLFEDKDGKRQLEAFFETLDLNGLRAKMVVVLNATPEQLAQFYAQGARIQNVESGGKRISLKQADLAQAFQIAISGFTFLPKTDLPEDVLIQRFGQPAEKVVQKGQDDGKLVNWIYPDKQLQIMVSDSAREVFHYGE